MRILILGAVAAVSTLAGCTDYNSGPRSYGYSSYDYNRPDPSYGGYYADRYYREGANYREHRLSRNDRVYRGQDGRYYCRRSDGTTGLVVGGIAGGVLGNIIAPGGSELLGTVLGAAAGAAVGSSVDKNSSDARCR
ncbi:glycine zipper 2TM domain-containing protein [Sphingomonas sp. R-74633]|uniref:glycine zipper 2TM domain-containing protein n=1 Tax=Sphingomonas sp. R-74633 TaxID=2751188 RepID=UPI0015D421FA|nr:glycine zipper 2TM domain-containing protein [Sphingomonas sp. R-74633]NYT42866.1 glycine zipper 2TM domain-containing protein [Sphingomonas sp. R-74633]